MCNVIYDRRISWLLSDKTQALTRGDGGLLWMSLMQLIFALSALTLTDDQLIETVIEIPNAKNSIRCLLQITLTYYG